MRAARPRRPTDRDAAARPDRPRRRPRRCPGAPRPTWPPRRWRWPAAAPHPGRGAPRWRVICCVPLRSASPSLASRRSGARPSSASAAGTVERPAAELGAASADEGQRQVGKRREVSRCPHRALLGHERVEAQSQEVEEALDDGRPAPARPRASVLARSRSMARTVAMSMRRPDAHGVADEEVLLEPAGVVRVDPHRGQVAEPGRHPVDGLAPATSRSIVLRLRLRGRPCVGPSSRASAAEAGDRLDVGEAEVAAVHRHDTRRAPLASAERRTSRTGRGMLGRHHVITRLAFGVGCEFPTGGRPQRRSRASQPTTRAASIRGDGGSLAGSRR